MKKIFLFCGVNILLIFTSVLIYGMSDEYIKNIEEEFWPNGKLKRRSELLNGKKNGWEISWGVDGDKVEAVTYINGRKSGIMQCWKSDGLIIKEMIYVNDTLKMYRNYDWGDKGDVSIQEEYYENGKTKIENWSASHLISLSFYINGIESDEWTEWYESGQLKSVGKYDTVFSDKEYSKKYETAWVDTLSSANVIHKNVKNGVWYYYSEKGQLIIEEKWHKGILIKRKKY